MEKLIDAFLARGDLAHLALLLWALAASTLVWRMLGLLAETAGRFDDFVREIARFNTLFGDDT
ncbi:hypothetical protein MWN34_05450 [Ancylobacter sp. 6x-1]|uniref:Uncharacterized protein n=1 Tax=Ancylobacter crimeensis TaxID=2579147 RepID=A0ABT0D8S6_9HYPH|nr:hypothetical protein [Ancylobacter crimeensis]MCK0196356.1 hypothetical protein [Ancylobacter crimeensis]